MLTKNAAESNTYSLGLYYVNKIDFFLFNKDKRKLTILCATFQTSYFHFSFFFFLNNYLILIGIF